MFIVLKHLYTYLANITVFVFDNGQFLLVFGKMFHKIGPDYNTVPLTNSIFGFDVVSVI